MEDRRGFFRIDDVAYVMASPWQNGHESAPEYFPGLKSLLLNNEIKLLDKQAADLHLRIQDEDLAALMQVQNRKIQLISQFLSSYELQDIGTPAQTISIGEGGISFSSDEEFQKGQELAMAIVFSPSYLPVFARSTVVGGDKFSDNTRYHCEFQGFTNQVRQQLMQHLLRQQTAQRQQKLADQ